MPQIQPNIPIHLERGYSFSRDFFQGFFNYGNDRYQLLDQERYLGPLGLGRNLNDVAVRHTRVAQPILLIALKIIAIATIILPLVGLLILLEQRDIRQNKNYIINPDPWNPPDGGAPQAAGARININRAAVEPPAPFRLRVDPNRIAPPPVFAAPAENAEVRIADIEMRYAQYKREVDRVGDQLAAKGFKNRLDLLKKVEVDIARGGTDADIYDRIQGSWFVHGENIDDIKKKKEVNGRLVEVSLAEKKEAFVDQMRNEIGLIHIMIERTSLLEVMEECNNAAPCLQGTMTALQTLLARVNNIVGHYEQANPDKNVDDLIPDLVRTHDAVQRTTALLQVYFLYTADTLLKAEDKPSTSATRKALANDERFQKIHFSIAGIIEWMKRNRYVGNMATKIKNNGVEGEIYSEEIAAIALDHLYHNHLMLDDVEIEVQEVDPTIVEAQARHVANAARMEEDARIARKLHEQLEREEAEERARAAGPAGGVAPADEDLA